MILLVLEREQWPWKILVIWLLPVDASADWAFIFQEYETLPVTRHRYKEETSQYMN